MKHNQGKWFLLPAVLLFTACQKPQDPVARGRAHFVGLGCNTCHTIAGRGGGQAGPDLTYVGFRKSPEWLDLWLKDPAAWKPGTAMPNFKLQDNVRADIVAYMSTLKGDAYRQDPPWDAPKFAGDPVKRGEALFQYAGCVGCHGVKGAGGYVNNNVVGGKIPALTFTADGYSKEELKDLLAKGRVSTPEDPSKPAPLIAMPAWGQVLKEDEIEALVEYVYSLRPAKQAGDDWSE